MGNRLSQRCRALLLGHAYEFQRVQLAIDRSIYAGLGGKTRVAGDGQPVAPGNRLVFLLS